MQSLFSVCISTVKAMLSAQQATSGVDNITARTRKCKSILQGSNLLSHLAEKAIPWSANVVYLPGVLYIPPSALSALEFLFQAEIVVLHIFVQF